MSRSRLFRPLAAVTAAGAATALLAAVAPTSVADTAPPSGTPATVTADALPTWQINGVVWSQVTVGNVVYATGSFTRARPPGVAPGGAGEVPAKNFFAYDIRTGNRVASLQHSLNAQGLVISAAPDGKTVYVGGDFTKVDGHRRGHVAAFKVSTHSLVPRFTPSVNGPVRAIAATKRDVYVGGNFSRVNGKVRHRLVKLAPSTGSVRSWRPTTNANVQAMVIAPGGSRLIVGGSFTKLSGTSAYGMGSLSTSTGKVQPWAANRTIRDATSHGGITDLTTDGKQIYGSGYSYNTRTVANFEGTFAAAPKTGVISWLDDCHGDTYSVKPIGKVLYSAGHPHNCSAIGEWPESDPKTYMKAVASTTYPTGTNTGPDSYGWNFSGIPAALHLTWFPDLADGSFTSSKQGAWSVTGNASYVAFGGEFPTVNGVAQQGLVRFAVARLAPKKSGPVSAQVNLTPSTPTYGVVDLSWTAQWDRDNKQLTYQVLRGGTPLASAVPMTQDSTFWQRPALSAQDTTVVPGTSYNYQVRITDPDGNSTDSPAVTVVARAAP